MPTAGENTGLGSDSSPSGTSSDPFDPFLDTSETLEVEKNETTIIEPSDPGPPTDESP